MEPRVEVPKPVWTTSSFLLYAGGLTVLLAAVLALVFLGGAYGSAAFAGWAALVLAGLAVVALLFRGAGNWIASGVFAVAAVVAWAVFLGALENWWGWLPTSTSGPFSGFRVGVLALELLVLAGALVANRSFQFPLLMLEACAAAWFFVTDLLSNGGNWSAVVTLLVGASFLWIGVALDRRPGGVYGFWLHVASGLTVGGALIFFWHHGDLKWSLVALGGIGYVWLARPTARSSWAVLGAVGLYLSAEHFAEKWGYGFLAFYFYGEDGARKWATPLIVAVLGFLLVVLGLLHGDRRRGTRPGSDPGHV